MIILHCVESDSVADNMVDELEKFADVISVEMLRHLFDVINEIYLFDNTEPFKSSYSSISTPRLIPLIYRLINRSQIYYRETDKFSYEFINEQLRRFDLQEQAHKVRMIDLRTKRERLNHTIDNYLTKIERWRDLAKKSSSDERDRLEMDIAEHEDLINKARVDTDNVNEKYNDEEKNFERLVKESLNETTMEYKHEPDVFPVPLSDTERKKISTQIRRVISSSIINSVNAHYDELLVEKGTEAAVQEVGIKNYQIFSNILSRLSTERRTDLHNVDQSRRTQDFTFKNFGESMYMSLMRGFVKNMENRTW
jgi:predicted  nucleic acid-binding Zn-ribbon protein